MSIFNSPLRPLLKIKYQKFLWPIKIILLQTTAWKSNEKLKSQKCEISTFWVQNGNNFLKEIFLPKSLQKKTNKLSIYK
jgi:hypothetical protein